ncbi:SusD/RagB family nutrient-binding outer membrane lipoprotein [Prevotella sp. KH2C16]|uniref:SusD/RagB family nutrient-binding outer membrane lipoprotein n=1 Tax=Prevotella sp. KH2C16 TaxID=1855325 RepID=UPI0008E16499|nr:SusD/RagB family nutrient-binding outer membrane lipoprotein [Prevotella sp. KH2C16]SFF90882.1 Susd and RagB outer membrane lipoprotein [Prevotella sp. KH2C16]
MIKKYISKVALLGVTVVNLFGMASCTAGFEEANRPGSSASAEELGRDNYTIGSFLVQMQNAVFPEQENDFQMDYDLIGNYLARYMTYTQNGWNGANFVTMNAPVNWVRYPFKSLTPKFTSAFNDIVRLCNGKKDLNYAWALILRAHGYLTMTDMYGPFPIGAVEGDENAYSSQKDIYTHLIADLDEALAILKTSVNGESFTANQNYDKVYGGKFAKWMRFANSLKLRMAIRMSGVDPATAKKVGEEAVAAGVIEDNDDNLAISYTPHGLYKTSVEWGDSRACADIESFMNGYEDPRIGKYFKEAAEHPSGFRPIIGCRAGAKIGNKSVAVPLYSAANVANATKGIWLTAAEMWFCRAEGALIGWQNMGEGNSVGSLYNKAIATSFKQWEAGDATSYINNSWSIQADYTDAQGGFGHYAPHVSNITVKWEDNVSIEQKMERLITQKWIALFPCGQEGWSELRRTGYPEVFAVDQTTAYSVKVPNRIPFADTEKTENATNLEKARQMLGGPDNYVTPMWWQKKWWQN